MNRTDDNAEQEESPTLTVDGKQYSRVRYGEEKSRERAIGPCHDCHVMPGRLHQWGCDAEECPVCGGQAFFCDCGDGDGSDEVASRGGKPVNLPDWIGVVLLSLVFLAIIVLCVFGWILKK